MAYSLGMEPSDVGSEQVGGGALCCSVKQETVVK